MSNSSKHLLEALRHLAMPAEKQMAYLRKLGVAPSADELALEFDDSIGAVSLAPEVQAQVQVLDRHLQSMSGAENSSLWDFEALCHSNEWQQVRRLAQLALESLEHESDC